MPSGDIMRATFEGVFNGEPVDIGLGFVSLSGAETFTEDAGLLAQEIREALDLTNIAPAFLAPLSGGYTLNNIRISDLAPGVAASQLANIDRSGGNVTDDALPSAMALCVTWRTELKGKSNRGRSYLTGFAEDSQNAGYWIPEIQEWARASFAEPLFAAFGPGGTGNYQLSVVHTMAGGVRLSPPTATPVSTFTINNTGRFMRRRGVGVRISRRRSAP